MKKILLVPALAATLMLAACNTSEEGTVEDTKDEQTTGQQQETPAETTAPTEEVTETPVVEETPAVEQPAEAEDTVTEVKIYVSDANAEAVELGETITHSLQKDGPLTKFIIDKLALTEYYNSHVVSADEKTITLDFKESIATSSLVQGSAGGGILAGQIYASFFNTLPELENLQLRIEGNEKELDHISFSGTVTREDFLAANPELAK